MDDDNYWRTYGENLVRQETQRRAEAQRQQPQPQPQQQQQRARSTRGSESSNRPASSAPTRSAPSAPSVPPSAPVPPAEPQQSASATPQLLMSFGVSFNGGHGTNPTNGGSANDSILAMARLLSRLTFEYAAMSGTPGQFEAIMETVIREAMSGSSLGNFNPGDFVADGSASFERLLNELFEQAMASSGGPAGPPGLSEEQFALLPRRKVAMEDSSSCAICQDAFKVDMESVVVLPCSHVYHEDCIGPWVKRISSCPICRRPVDEHKQK